ncbi:MAG TPA: hypothetical protein VGG09_15875 [Acidimicrobiales bacterium]|jgi:hypothetical protein
MIDVATLSDLHETSERHDPYEKSHAPHNWWDWYAASLHAREGRSTADDAAIAGHDMEDVLGILPK